MKTVLFSREWRPLHLVELEREYGLVQEEVIEIYLMSPWRRRPPYFDTLPDLTETVQHRVYLDAFNFHFRDGDQACARLMLRTHDLSSEKLLDQQLRDPEFLPLFARQLDAKLRE